jgi:hypothetical protein
MPVGDSPLGEVIGRHLKGYSIARKNTDAVTSEFTRQMGEHGSILI